MCSKVSTAWSVLARNLPVSSTRVLAARVEVGRVGVTGVAGLRVLSCLSRPLVLKRAVARSQDPPSVNRLLAQRRDVLTGGIDAGSHRSRSRVARETNGLPPRRPPTPLLHRDARDGTIGGWPWRCVPRSSFPETPPRIARCLTDRSPRPVLPDSGTLLRPPSPPLWLPEHAP